MIIESEKWRRVITNYECLCGIYQKEQRIDQEDERDTDSVNKKIKHHRNRAQKTKKIDGITPMRKLIKMMPDVAKTVLDKCVNTEIVKDGPMSYYKVHFDFECIDDTYFWNNRSRDSSKKTFKKFLLII